MTTTLAPEILKVVCGWCKKTIREGNGQSSDPVSHGICESCAAVHFPEAVKK